MALRDLKILRLIRQAGPLPSCVVLFCFAKFGLGQFCRVGLRSHGEHPTLLEHKLFIARCFLVTWEKFTHVNFASSANPLGQLLLPYIQHIIFSNHPY